MVISRAQWGARRSPGRALRGPLDLVIVHTEAVRRDVQPQDVEIAAMRAMERYHVEHNGWSGIGYNHVIFPSGRIYEGRGWLREGAHAYGYNDVSQGICFAGHGDLDPATPEQWVSAWWLIAEGVERGVLRPRPKIAGHRDYTDAKSCPGDLIYPHLDLLHGIAGHEPEDEDMPLTDRDLDSLEGMMRRILGEAVGPGQRTWPGTVYATLDGVQETFNYARSTHERLEMVEGELAATRAALEYLTGRRGDAGGTEQLPPRS